MEIHSAYKRQYVEALSLPFRPQSPEIWMLHGTECILKMEQNHRLII